MVECSRCAVGKEQNEVERQKVKLLEEMEREVMDIQHGGSRQQRAARIPQDLCRCYTACYNSLR